MSLTNDNASCLNKPSAAFAITMRVELSNHPGEFPHFLEKINKFSVSMAEVTIVTSDFDFKVRDVSVYCRNKEHADELIAYVKELESITLIDHWDDTFLMHEEGKLSVESTIELCHTDQLSQAYTPGVARVCTAIEKDPDLAYDYTVKCNTVAVVSDGTAVLGLGDIGPLGAMPVMEGKAILFKTFADIDAFPICLSTKDTKEIIKTVEHIAPTFGGINLEDISAPRCFEIEEELQKRLDIPVFHDDQHGTAVVVLAGTINALKIVDKKFSEIKVVINGFGAGGVACARILQHAGVKNIVACDRTGIIYSGRKEGMNAVKERMAEITNPDYLKGSLKDALPGADMFLGLSGPNVLSQEMVKGMGKDPIIFALANPQPEIMPEELEGIARVVATGRSDYANQANNVLCFPGIFRGALDCRATKITDNMKFAAAEAIADAVSEKEREAGVIIPGLFKKDLAGVVARRVKEAAITDGVARLKEG